MRCACSWQIVLEQRASRATLSARDGRPRRWRHVTSPDRQRSASREHNITPGICCLLSPMALRGCTSSSSTILPGRRARCATPSSSRSAARSPGGTCWRPDCAVRGVHRARRRRPKCSTSAPAPPARRASSSTRSSAPAASRRASSSAICIRSSTPGKRRARNFPTTRARLEAGQPRPLPPAVPAPSQPPIDDRSAAARPRCRARTRKGTHLPR